MNNKNQLYDQLKSVAKPWVEERHRSPIVHRIFDGTLNPAVMRRWLEQDLFYLQAYARVLARLAALAPERHMSTLIDGAHYTIHTEMGRLGELVTIFDANMTERTPGNACRSYIDYLNENSEVFETGIVSVLPCMIGFAALGLEVELPQEPRYRRWIEIYSATDFQDHSARFPELVNSLEIDRNEATAIFERGMAMEISLWNDAAQVGGMDPIEPS